MNDNASAFIVLGRLNAWWMGLDTGKAYWSVKCPACSQVHERVVHRHWDSEKRRPVESHQIICMENKTTYFISAIPPFVVLRETHFGLTREIGAKLSDDQVPF